MSTENQSLNNSFGVQDAAKAMNRTPEMQESVYNSQIILDRIAPIYELNERLWEELIKSPSKQEN